MLLATLQSAQTTQIPLRLFLTSLMVLVLVLAVFAIRKAWLKKAALQSDILAPMATPEDFEAVEVFSGRYLASTYASDWLKRIVVHGLGLPSRVQVSISAKGIRLNLNNNRDIFIPADAITEVKADRAIAGRAFEKDGIAVIVWQLGETEIASGFRADTNEQHLKFLQATTKKEIAK